MLLYCVLVVLYWWRMNFVEKGSCPDARGSWLKGRRSNHFGELLKPANTLKYFSNGTLEVLNESRNFKQTSMYLNYLKESTTHKGILKYIKVFETRIKVFETHQGIWSTSRYLKTYQGISDTSMYLKHKGIWNASWYLKHIKVSETHQGISNTSRNFKHIRCIKCIKVR